MFRYRLYPSGLDLVEFRKILNENGGVEDERNPDFVWVETNIYGMYEKSMYGIKCFCKTILADKKSITDKSDLYYNLSRLRSGVPFMAAHVDLKDCKPGTPYIFKPVGREGSSGNDIKVLTSGFEEYAKYLHNKHGKYVICDYIADVDLFKGKKYHMRMYLSIRAKTNTLPFKWSLFNIGKILTARLPYQKSDFGNSDIHDTHTKSTDDDYFCEVDPQMLDICADIAELVAGIKPYPESKTAFEVFGLDFMRGVDGKIWLLEVNDKIGYNSVLNVKNQKKIFTEKYSNFSRDFFTWVWKENMKELFNERQLVI
jgi:hypothetical protein